jgi:hypothetical protein
MNERKFGGSALLLFGGAGLLFGILRMNTFLVQKMMAEGEIDRTSSGPIVFGALLALVGIYLLAVDDSPQAGNVHRDPPQPEILKHGPMSDLDAVVELLSKHAQRATYGAVAGVVGGSARSVIQDRARTPLNSWVVAVATGQPTGYGANEVDVRLPLSGGIIEDAGKLQAWLTERGFRRESEEK